MRSLLDPSLELPSAFTRLSCVVGLSYCAWRYAQAKRSPLNAIPTVGYSGILTSYITAFKWTWNALELLQEGYDQYPGQAFKVATMSRWVVVLSGKQHMEDIRKAPEDVVSFREAVAELLQEKYTLGTPSDDDPYHWHVETIRSPLTRNLAHRFEDIRDEIVESFKDYIPETEDWTSVAAHDVMMHIVCRTSNRYFVGLPLCREPSYRSLNETFTEDVVISALLIGCFPDFVKPLVGWYMTPVPKAVKRALDYFGSTLEERLMQEKQRGAEWAKRPNDLITWLLENTTQERHRTVHHLILRVLSVNFGAIHTSTTTLTQSLYDLAIHPEYVEDMRKEAEAVITEEGWTKAAMQKMRKIDSFLKESQRLNSPTGLAVGRNTLKDWTLSDGTLIPAGTSIGVAADAMNKEEMSFPDAHKFKGFRFAKLRDDGGELGAFKHQMVFIGPDQVSFGYGRHACPGRFFAVNEIKAMFAHILLNYDVQLENGSMDRPVNRHFGPNILSNTKAKVMFRRRRT